tara:strand:+ start:12538 stop:13689 length:1152 start_codon:yes stop_codon:yes gene_type:complete
MNKCVIVFGGDGFCGWPTSLRLAASGYRVVIVDNLSRRRIDDDLGSESLTEIASIEDRIEAASEHFGEIIYENIDVAHQPKELLSLLVKYSPQAVIQFAEQRAAPYSMIGSKERRYTVDNNISGTHNICDAIVSSGLDIHLVHLGTMGVYGYSKEFGGIPEGYLDITINSTKQPTSILYPANPGSVYHMTKCLDQLIFQFYSKNWGLKVTDLHQGIVWGVETKETIKDKRLVNRFDYDGVYGTVLNRFISQAVNNEKLTVYGTGGQTRAFIHINDTAECLKLAVENDKFDPSRPRIFNQVAEVASVKDLADMISQKTGIEIVFLENPRKELAENELEVSNEGLVNLGFNPTLLNEGLIDDIMTVAEATRGRFNKANVNTSPKW